MRGQPLFLPTMRFGSVNDTEASVFSYSVFTRFVRPLIFTDASEMCKAAGWGHADISQEFGEGSSDTLLAVDIPIIDYNVCKYKYDTDDEVEKGDFKINEGNICAGSNGKEACIVYKH